MVSYTAMSNEAIRATVEAMRATGEPYPMTLNASDFECLVSVLKFASYRSGNAEVREWSESFLSGIAETLGVEFV